MSEKADLEKKAIEALERYREAYARAEALEQEEAAARQEVFRRLNRLEIAKAKGGCRVALNCKNAPLRARYCSLLEKLFARYYQLC
jgi:hypothetical protein